MNRVNRHSRSFKHVNRTCFRIFLQHFANGCTKIPEHHSSVLGCIRHRHSVQILQQNPFPKTGWSSDVAMAPVAAADCFVYPSSNFLMLKQILFSCIQNRLMILQKRVNIYVNMEKSPWLHSDSDMHLFLDVSTKGWECFQSLQAGLVLGVSTVCW